MKTGRDKLAEFLRAEGIRPRHRLGQNFLHDDHALALIAATAEIERGDTVLEVGCGFGGLTQHLAEVARAVVAVEVDPRLADMAARTLGAYPNVKVVAGDILRLAPAQLDLPEGYIVAANIPYYVTSPILRHLLESRPKPRRLVLTVQKEVAARMCAKPPDMSLLALSVQVYGNPHIAVGIPANAFYPVPKVDSAVVRVDVYPEPVVSAGELQRFFELARAGFQQKRKTLANSLAAALNLTSAQTRVLLEGVGIDPRRRAETLQLSEWERIIQFQTQ